MQQMQASRGKKLLFSIAVFAVFAGVLWWQRTPFLTWYYLRGLAAADETDQDKWARRVAGLGDSAVPALFDLLGREDVRACANARAALAYLVEHNGAGASGRPAIATQLAEQFSRLRPTGQREALGLAELLIARLRPGEDPGSEVVRAEGRLLMAAAIPGNSGVLDLVFRLADALVDHGPPPEVVSTIHGLVRAGMLDGRPSIRAYAVHVARASALNRPKDLLELAVPLLRDPSAPVRREAICLLACEKNLLGTEDLLAWLHDPDREVRRWCEKALLARGEPEINIRLGRLLTDQRPKERLKVFGYLRRSGHPAPGVWVLRLCDDPEPAVRIAAARAAVELCPPGNGMNIRDRLWDMAQNDQSATVRQVAACYYRQGQRAP